VILLNAPYNMKIRHENMSITNPEIVDSGSTEQKQEYGALRYSKYQHCEKLHSRIELVAAVRTLSSSYGNSLVWFGGFNFEHSY
jgi:hypothetical protein